MTRWAVGASCIVLLLVGPARSDSPLTSTEFHSAYAGEIAKLVDDPADDPKRVIEVLLEKNPTDIKAALVNSLGWAKGGYARRFFEALALKKEVDPSGLDFGHLSAQDLFVLGYLLAMEDYFELKALEPKAKGLRGASAMDLLSRAAIQAPSDFTIQLITGLARAQLEMKRSSCGVYQTVQTVLAAFPAERRDFKPEALRIITGYIDLYRKDCAPPAPGANPEFNQIYRIAFFQGWVATGTQAGVALWDRTTRRLHSVHPDTIVGSLLVWQGALWSGSYNHVRRFDAKRWKVYLSQKGGSEAFHLFEGPKGELLAQKGGKFWRFERGADKFVPLPSPTPGVSPYDCLYRKNGELWTIDFLNKLLVDGRPIGLRSEVYPGRDPRQFVEDTKGTLWVIDFEDGFFRYDDPGRRFVRDPAVESQASDLVLDPRSSRLYLLHYRNGLTVRTPEQAAADSLDLHSLEYMRTLALDDEGVLWVGGWNQLLRLSPAGDRWTQESLAVSGR